MKTRKKLKHDDQNASLNSTDGGGNKQQTRPAREHTTTQTIASLTTVPATTSSITTRLVDISSSGNQQHIRSNGIAEHLTGAFPNSGNPNRISEQAYTYTTPTNPLYQAGSISRPARGYVFGTAINGVPFDPSAGEWYLGVRSQHWQYAALSSAIALGLNDNHAHVQPTGAYHYHGKPTGLLSTLSISSSIHSPLVGWAADGFPIYAQYGFADSQDALSYVSEMTSGYAIKTGQRPSGDQQPGGYYDGTFIGDYEYIAGLGTLDECNGRFTVSPEFPNGNYAYFISNEWPQIPRCFKGSPDPSFIKHRR